jgi:hypothetical protein
MYKYTELLHAVQYYTPLPATINPDCKGCLIASKPRKESERHIYVEEYWNFYVFIIP